MNPIHIITDKKNISKNVIMPGDPLRAKYIAENFLTNAVCVCNIRNNLVYTGYYKNNLVTVASSGMGIPSMGIYSYELYKFYDVEKIIRVGTCGSFSPKVHPKDIILADSSFSPSSFNYQMSKENSLIEYADKDLTNKIYEISKGKVKKGTIYTSDVFDVYFDINHILDRIPKEIELLGSEMEAFGLFHVAKTLGKKAACLATVTDSKYEPNIFITPQERQTNLNEMIILALESII